MLTKRNSCVLAAGLALAGCGDGGMEPPPPGGSVLVDLTVGESVTVSDADAVSSFEIVGGEGARTYQVIVQSASRSAGSTQAMQLQVTADGVAASVAPTRASPRVRSSALAARQPGLRERAAMGEAKFKSNVRRSIESAIAAAPDGSRSGTPLRLSTARSVPAVGEMLTLNVLTNISGSCTSTTPVTGEVQFVGQRVALVEDTQLAGAFTAQQWQALGQQLDVDPFAINAAYFGQPDDMDGNDRVILLVTAEVNKLTPRNSNSLIAGFFWSGDLLPLASCVGSNEGEVLYLVGPDPTADFSDAISIETAESLIASTGAHELQHLISAQRRVAIAGTAMNLSAILDDAWIDEGLAHLAEELAGLGVAGLGTRGDIGLDPWVATPTAIEAFNDYMLRNVARLGEYLLDPASAMALGTVNGGDPQGEESLTMRGFGWGFARWLGDQFGPAGNGILPGSNEEALFRELTTGGPGLLTGIDNVERAVQTVGGATIVWNDLLALYLTSLIADNFVPAADGRERFLTYDLRDLFGDLSNSNIGGSPPFATPYPLIPTDIALGPTTNVVTNFTVGASTAEYFRFTAAGASPRVTVELTTPTGAAFPQGTRAQITVLRTQ